MEFKADLFKHNPLYNFVEEYLENLKGIKIIDFESSLEPVNSIRRELCVYLQVDTFIFAFHNPNG